VYLSFVLPVLSYYKHFFSFIFIVHTLSSFSNISVKILTFSSVHVVYICVCHGYTSGKYPFPASCSQKTCLKIGHVLMLQVSGAIKLAQEMLFTHDILRRKSLVPENLRLKLANLNAA